MSPFAIVHAFLILTLLYSHLPPSSTCDLVATDPDTYVLRNTSFRCPCLSGKCVQKCCADGYTAVNKTCVRDPEVVFDVAIHDRNNRTVWETFRTHLELSYGFVSCQSRVRLRRENRDEFYILEDGKQWFPYSNEVRNAGQYCVDFFNGDNWTLEAYVCALEEAPEPRNARIAQILCMIISMPFLLITFLVYATLPDRNIHGKSLMCYVLSLLLAYVFLVAILMKSDYQPVPCQILAYVCYFFFLASFFWMNVMCIDIWWTFSGKRGIVGSKRKSQKRFILFSCYAWGVPIFFLALLAVLNHTLPENSDFHPKVGYMKCWISDGVPLLLYFYGTMALLIVFNVILFILTALKIRQAKKETAMLKKGDSKRHSYENEKQRFNLYLKLLLAMGLNWAMEVISWIFEWQVKDLPKTVWILTDTCNALYGVFIFFIFVFKRNIWNHLQRRYYVFTGRSVKANNLANSISNPTRTTSQSFQDKIPMGEVASSVGP